MDRIGQRTDNPCLAYGPRHARCIREQGHTDQERFGHQFHVAYVPDYIDWLDGWDDHLQAGYYK